MSEILRFITGLRVRLILSSEESKSLEELLFENRWHNILGLIFHIIVHPKLPLNWRFYMNYGILDVLWSWFLKLFNNFSILIELKYLLLTYYFLLHLSISARCCMRLILSLWVLLTQNTSQRYAGISLSPFSQRLAGQRVKHKTRWSILYVMYGAWCMTDGVRWMIYVRWRMTCDECIRYSASYDNDDDGCVQTTMYHVRSPCCSTECDKFMLLVYYRSRVVFHAFVVFNRVPAPHTTTHNILHGGRSPGG